MGPTARPFEECPTCGAPVVVHSGDDGISHYQPADDDDVGCQLSRIECDMLEIHDALEVVGLPGAINAESIIERIEALAGTRGPAEPEAVCDRCGAPKGLQAVGESCNTNCGGRVVANPRAVKPITLCNRCFRPEATEEQWATIPEGEGDELCWGMGANCGMVDPEEVLLARVVELAAERDTLQVRVDAAGSALRAILFGEDVA